MQKIDGDVFLGVEDEDVGGALHLVAKALSESYGGTYDPPKNLEEGWIGIKVSVNARCIKAVPKDNVREEVFRLLKDASFFEDQQKASRHVDLDGGTVRHE